MAFRLDSNGADVWTVSNDTIKPGSVLDPKLAFHADFVGAKILKFTSAVDRAAGADPSSMERHYFTSGQLYLDFDIWFGKTFTVPPMMFAGMYDDYHGVYWIDLNKKLMHNTGTFGADNIQGFSIQLKSGCDGVTVRTYNANGTFILYVVDGP